VPSLRRPLKVKDRDEVMTADVSRCPVHDVDVRVLGHRRVAVARGHNEGVAQAVCPLTGA
jgi:hypothetical protein